jgi:hypothetical protein
MSSEPSARLHILQHSLGLNEYGQGRPYRNHFVTGPGSSDYDRCMALVAAGLMTRRAGSELTGGGDLFTVTDAGRAFVTENSPAPPTLTRGQHRYRRYLASDSGLTFGEWLKAIRT